MAISKNTRDFVDSLIDYYISEAPSYKQIADEYVPEVDSVIDTAFGIITGCVYSGFLQAYKNQKLSPSLEDIQEFNKILTSLEDIQEFNKILKDRAPIIKKAMIENSHSPHLIDKSKKIEKIN
jgi:hypothetical protein